MVEISEYTYLSTAAQRRTINKCLCCLPFHSEQQILSSSSLLARKVFVFLNWRRAADGRIRKMHKTIFSSARRRSAGRTGLDRAVRFVDFRCGSRTLLILAFWTLCFPTLGWILSPVILYPRRACNAFRNGMLRTVRVGVWATYSKRDHAIVKMAQYVYIAHILRV